jgi:DNA-binding transcriptional MerR regulator
MCGVAGFAVGEIGTALLTGGLAAGARFVASAAKNAVKAGARASRLSALATRTMQSIPRARAALARATTAVVEVSAKTLTAAQRNAIRAFEAIANSRVSTAIGAAARTAKNSAAGEALRFTLRPAAFYLNAMDEAAALGYRSVDNALAGGAVRGADAVSDVARVADAPRPEPLPDIIDDVPAEARATVAIDAPESRQVIAAAESNAGLADDVIEARPGAGIADDDIPSPVIRVADETPTPAPASPSVSRTPAATSGDTAITVGNRVDDVPVPQAVRATPEPSPSIVRNDRAPEIRTQRDTPSPAASRSDDSITVADNDRSIGQFLGREPDLFQREAILECILNNQSTIGAKKRFLQARPGMKQFYADQCRRLNLPENAAIKAQIREEAEALARSRLASANRQVDDEIAELGADTARADTIPCTDPNVLYGGSFPATGGNCKRLRATKDITDVYCGCGDASKARFNFIVKCPKNAAGFQAMEAYFDSLALPAPTRLEMCGRVKIPAGKDCILGPTTAAFAGFGGSTQLLCLNGVSSRMRAQPGAERVLENLEGIDLPITPTRWSPFSDFDEYHSIVQTAAERCAQKCSPEDLARLQSEYASKTAELRSRFANNPEQLSRLDDEKILFDDFFDGLQNGRRARPNENTRRYLDLRNAARLDDTERLRQAEDLINGLTRSKTRRTLTPDERRAVLDAHNLGDGRGFDLGPYTSGDAYTAADIAAKARRLREAGFNPQEVRSLMENGITGSVPATQIPALNRLQAATRDISRNTRGVADMRLRDLNYPQSMTADQINERLAEARNLYKSSGDSYASVARSPQGTAEDYLRSVDSYARSGNVDEAYRVARESGAKVNMNAVKADVQRNLDDVIARRRENPRNPELGAQEQNLRNLLAKIDPSTAPRAPAALPVTPARREADFLAANAENNLRNLNYGSNTPQDISRISSEAVTSYRSAGDGYATIARESGRSDDYLRAMDSYTRAYSPEARVMAESAISAGASRASVSARLETRIEELKELRRLNPRNPEYGVQISSYEDLLARVKNPPKAATPTPRPVSQTATPEPAARQVARPTPAPEVRAPAATATPVPQPIRAAQGRTDIKPSDFWPPARDRVTNAPMDRGPAERSFWRNIYDGNGEDAVTTARATSRLTTGDRTERLNDMKELIQNSFFARGTSFAEKGMNLQKRKNLLQVMDEMGPKYIEGTNNASAAEFRRMRESLDNSIRDLENPAP